jgi:transcriptional regulator with XRE-family HTH domain
MVLTDIGLLVYCEIVEPNVSLAKVRRILLKRRGALSELAKALGVSRTTVTRVLQGKATSKRILNEALRKAAEIEGMAALKAGSRG